LIPNAKTANANANANANAKNLAELPDRFIQKVWQSYATDSLNCEKFYNWGAPSYCTSVNNSGTSLPGFAKHMDNINQYLFITVTYELINDTGTTM